MSGCIFCKNMASNDFFSKRLICSHRSVTPSLSCDFRVKFSKKVFSDAAADPQRPERLVDMRYLPRRSLSFPSVLTRGRRYRGMNFPRGPAESSTALNSRNKKKHHLFQRFLILITLNVFKKYVNIQYLRA